MACRYTETLRNKVQIIFLTVQEVIIEVIIDLSAMY